MTQDVLLTHELMALRQELHNLKTCQITFLTLSVTATGGLLGLGTSFADQSILSLVALSPLVLILPSWWIFFDKATTITRIVGYYRILEKLVINRSKSEEDKPDPDIKNIRFIGWENSLKKFREHQEHENPPCEEEYKIKSFWSGIAELVILKTKNLYWVISFYVFLGLSALCVGLSLAKTLTGEIDWRLFSVGILAGIMFVVSFWWNVNRVWELIYGKHRYNCNEDIWTKVLDKNKN
jgi:hypothetical protein